MTTASIRPVALRNGVGVDDPIGVVLGFVEAGWAYDVDDAPRPQTFDESDLRLANRGGARISAAEIAAILARRRPIEQALRSIAPEASLAEATSTVPWQPLRELMDLFDDIPGVGLSKVTKAVHRKRAALIPLLDSVVQRYLEDDDPGLRAPFGERAIALVKAYKHDLDRNRTAVRAVRRELARRGHRLTEVRILDLLIWSIRPGA